MLRLSAKNEMPATFIEISRIAFVTVINKYLLCKYQSYMVAWFRGESNDQNAKLLPKTGHFGILVRVTLY